MPAAMSRAIGAACFEADVADVLGADLPGHVWLAAGAQRLEELGVDCSGDASDRRVRRHDVGRAR